MAFTTWSALRDDLKDALSDLAAGNPFTDEYTIGSRKHKVKTAEDIKALYKLTYDLEELETAGQVGNIVSYGSYKRYQ